MKSNEFAVKSIRRNNVRRPTLIEAFDTTRREKGQVPFKSSSLKDPHIRAIIAQVSKKTGVPPADIFKKIQDSVDEISKIQKYSPVLYDIAVKNAVESAAFDLIENVENSKFEKFNPIIFDKLTKLIRQDHRQFFPVRQPGGTKYVYGFNPILVPTKNKDLAKYNSCSTAAASPKGEFIFNTEFMQKLMDWATISNLKPKGNKYNSNGGPIPDCYGYIEFLIVHELLHFSYGDFNYGKQMPEFSHKVHNYASDFRSNYMLVKNGYSQLPIGLYSDDINSDRQESYKEMAQLVHDELKKIPKDLQQHVPKPADEHGEGEPGEEGGEGGEGEGKPGEGKPGEGEGKPGEGEGKPGEGEGKPGEGEGEGKPGSEGKPVLGDNGTPLPSPDDIHKDIENKLSGRGDTSGQPGEPGSNEEEGPTQKPKRSGSPGQGGLTGMGGGSSRLLDIKPKMNWKTLIRKLVQSSIPKTEISYAKPSRRSVTGAAIGAALGASAVKPGEKTLEEPVNKLVLVFDTSGSMSGTVEVALREAENLLKQLGKNKSVFGVTYFAGNHVSFALNCGEDYYAPLTNLTELNKVIPKDKKRKPWKQVLTLMGSGGTTFSPSMVEEFNTAARNGYNILIFSDSDILDGSNWTEFKKLYQANKRQVFFIADSASTWRSACSKLGQVSDNFTHL